MLWPSSKHQPNARQCGVMVKAVSGLWRDVGLSANPASATSWLCDFGQVALSPCASVSFCVKMEKITVT